MVIWFTGLSGTGKTTLSNYLKKELAKKGFSVAQVDGDVFRQRTKSKNRFSREEILKNNYRIISHCRAIWKDYDFIIVSVISPYQETRKKAREIFGKNYLEIFLDCPLKKLIKRDVKELYSKALKGEIKNLIGFSSNSPYEYPKECELKINTAKMSIELSLEIIKNSLKKHLLVDDIKNYGK